MGKFPQLIMYIWWQFKTFKSDKHSEVEEFYPYPMSPNNLDFTMFAGLLQDALKAHLEQGNLQSRYKVSKEAKPYHLEFRLLRNSVLQKILGGSFIIQLEINNHDIQCSWCGRADDEKIPGSKIRTKISNIGEAKCEIAAILISNKISQIDAKLIRHCNETDNRKIIIFTGEDCQNDENEKTAKDKLVGLVTSTIGGNVSEIPVTWEELSSSAQQIVKKKGRFKIQSNVINISSILKTEQLFSFLNGQMLNTCLKGTTCSIFRKHELPTKPDIYIERRISKIIRVNAKDIAYSLRVSTSESFVFTNVDLEMLQILLQLDKDKFRHIKVELIAEISLAIERLEETSCPRVFVLENDKQHSEDIVNIAIPNNYNGAGIHFFRFLRGSDFEWLGRVGVPNKEIGSLLPTENQLWNEDQFLEIVNANEKVVFIADKPGMGKTTVLANLARHVSETYPDRIVVFMTMTEFVKYLERLGSVNQNSVVAAIQYFISSNDLEKSIVAYYLNDKCVGDCVDVKFELMFDGLDEVGWNQKESAVNAIQLLREKIKFVRVWVTLRDYLLDDIPLQKFSSLCYKLEPFSNEKQADFLVQYWSNRIERGQKTCSVECLRNFALKVVEFPISEIDAKISGIPLQCRMLAEVYESKVVKGEFKLDNDTTRSLANLYGKMIQRKLEIYVREKKRIPEYVSMKDSLFDALRLQFYLSHVYFALNLIIGEKCANQFKNRLIITAQIDERLKRTVLQQGIIVKLNPLTFLHRTFAEFLIAWFVHEVSTGKLLHIPPNEDIFEDFLWNKVFMIDSYEGLVQHTDSAAGCYDLGIFYTFKLPTVCHFYNAIWKQASSMKTYKLVEHQMRHFKSLENDAKYGFFESYCVLDAVYESKNPAVFQLLINYPKHILEIFVNELQRHKYYRIKYLMEEIKCIKVKDWCKLQGIGQKRFGIMHWLIYGLGRVYTANVSIDSTKDFFRYIVTKQRTVVEHKDAEGRTPLLLLLQKEYKKRYNELDKIFKIELSRLLVGELGANVHCRDFKNNTVLHALSNYCITDMKNPRNIEQLLDVYSEILKYFMGNGCTQETMCAVNKNGETPFLSAFKIFGKYIINVLQVFKDGGADFDVKDEKGNTPLHTSIEHGFSILFVKSLLDFGADATTVNRHGQNSLHLAVQKGNNLELVKMLVESYGVNLELRDNDGKTAVEYQTSPDIQELLKEKYITMRKEGKKHCRQ